MGLPLYKRTSSRRMGRGNLERALARLRAEYEILARVSPQGAETAASRRTSECVRLHLHAIEALLRPLWQADSRGQGEQR